MNNLSTVIFIVFILFIQTVCPQTNACWFHEIFTNPEPLQCSLSSRNLGKSIYILYDVNPPEGFNLRRDVYIRLAVFVRNLQMESGFEFVKLVLPPFRRLYHWKSSHVYQDNVLWSRFFDIPSMKAFTPVLDYDEFLDEIHETLVDPNRISVDVAYQLKHFEDMFENGVFRDKYELEECKREEHLRGYLLHQPQLIENKFICLKFQGGASLLTDVLKSSIQRLKHSPKIFALLNAEIVLHDQWGSDEFWMARRSMRFNRELVKIANDFRKDFFNSTDDSDAVQRPYSWKDEKPYRGAIGGDYLCVHLRRGDFVHGREKTTPTLKSAGTQIRNKMRELGLEKLFVSSDCSQFEFKNLKSYLQRGRVYRFMAESLHQKSLIKDGGIAIIDQIICSHARYFIGTFESTFTYRIYEEREILGFPKDTTFNTFCKTEDLENCAKNSIWPIVY
ncbi:GDP-fucose protein O-fucosyltransferase 2 [Episyrphus balteatus]|uniref:GDP-fucose protein O-fucosyltransferase 2 n=1 Tax=Episyrphus balteatus TaxID=286459 RepID=UPI002484F23F|nr:GDP-fucose protein O-fucosyltransferase 2 [Episyrphus balteatus]